MGRLLVGEELCVKRVASIGGGSMGTGVEMKESSSESCRVIRRVESSEFEE